MPYYALLSLLLLPAQVDENLQRVQRLHQEVQAGVSELQLPSVDFDHLQNQLDCINQENTAQVLLHAILLAANLFPSVALGAGLLVHIVFIMIQCFLCLSW